MQVPRTFGRSLGLFPGTPWDFYHLDELQSDLNIFSLDELKDKSLSDIVANLQNETLARLIADCLSNVTGSIEPCENERAIDRIKLIIQELNHTYDSEYFAVLKRKLIDLMKLNEKVAESDCSWVVSLSSENRHLCEGHTFQEIIKLSVSKCIDRYMRMFLSICDANYGLDFLQYKSEWRGRFYISILDLLSEVEIQEHFFNLNKIQQIHCQLPFSWLLIQKMKEVLSKNAIALNPDSLLSIFLSSSLGENVLVNFRDHNPEIKSLFLSDSLLHFWPILQKHPSEILKFISGSIECLSVNDIKPDGRSKLFDEKIRDDELLFTDIFVIVMKHRQAITVLLQLLELHPNPSELVKKLNRPKETDFNDSVIQMIQLLMDHLDPVNHKLTDATSQKQWMHYGIKLTTLVRNFFKRSNVEIPDSIVAGLHKLEIVRLFIETVVNSEPSGQYQSRKQQSINQLCIILKKNFNFKSSETLNIILKIIDRTAQHTATLIFSGGVDKCEICLSELKDPVVLSCQHVICYTCLTNYKEERLQSNSREWKCPGKGCRRSYPPQFQLERSTECRKAVASHREFRSALNNFFLEILSRYVFFGNNPPDEEVLNILMSFVVTKKLPERDGKTTKKFGLFPGDYLDATPVLRSFIFKLIMKVDLNKAERFLNNYYQSEVWRVEDSFELKVELWMIIVYCMEDAITANLYGKESEASAIYQGGASTMFLPSNLLKSLIGFEIQDSTTIMQNLEFIAKLRLSLIHACMLIHKLVNSEFDLEEEEFYFLKQIEAIVNKFETELTKIFIIKEIVSKFSISTIIEWKKSEKFLNLFPKSLKLVDFDYHPDYFLVLGEEYISMKSSVFAAFELKQLDMASLDKLRLMHLRLAIYFYLRKLDPACEDVAENRSTLLDLDLNLCTQYSRDESVDDFITKIDNMMITSLRCKPIFAVLFHLKEALLYTDNPYLHLFGELYRRPNDCAEYYLPTMPQDDDIETRGAVADITRLYRCPKNHIYGVGDCGRIVTSARCPTCRLTIGLKQSNFTTIQDKQVQLTDTTQTGHILSYSSRKNLPVRERALTNIEVAAVRFLLHAAMLLCDDKTSVSRIINFEIEPGAVDTFLLNHLRDGFSHIVKLSGRNDDYAEVLLHNIVARLCEESLSFDDDLIRCESKAGRLQWEQKFSQEILQPCINNMDDVYQNVMERLQRSKESGSHAILSLIKSKEDVDKDADKFPFIEKLWNARHIVTVENLGTRVGEDELVKKCPLLNLLLSNGKHVQSLEILFSMSNLQSLLWKKFDNIFQMTDLEKKTVRAFLFEFIHDPNEREKLKEIVSFFLNCFIDLKEDLFQFSRNGANAVKHFNALNINEQQHGLINKLPASILFPCQYGLGLCCYATIEMLIYKHNTIMKAYIDVGQLHADDIPKLSLSEVSSRSQLFSYNEEELNMMLLANCSYDLFTENKRIEEDIDLLSLDKQVKDRFFTGRIFLDSESIPQYRYIDEVFNRPSQTSLKMKQKSLNELSQIQIDELLKSLPDLCKFLKCCVTLHKILSIIDCSGVDSTKSLTYFIRQFQLEMPQFDGDCDLFDLITLDEIEDLIQFLKVLRARRMVLLNQDPWNELPNRDLQVAMSSDDSNRQCIDECLRHIPADILLHKLYRFIEEKVAGFGEDELNYNLFESLKIYLEDIQDEDTANILDRFTSHDIFVKNAVDVFAYIIDKVY